MSDNRSRAHVLTSCIALPSKRKNDTHINKPHAASSQKELSFPVAREKHARVILLLMK